MVNIKIGSEYLDLAPGTTINRERQSPFFLSKNSSGSEGIPGEVSFPFAIPLTDRNMRLLAHPDHLPATSRGATFDTVLFDDVSQLSAGKMQLRGIDFDLNRPGAGQQQATMLFNTSAFARLIKDKNLTDLSLGGPRTFTWTGFLSGGFWAHAHSTWEYTSADDGDYVFFPVQNGSFGGFANTTNAIFSSSPAYTDIMLSPFNVVSLCPHTYVVAVIRAIFNEHGYVVTGDILNDPDFKKLCLLSFRGVTWSAQKTNAAEDGWVVEPLASITLNLGEHMPPNVGIGQFLIELQKLLPLGYNINDNSRTCEITLLGEPTPAARRKDFTGRVAPRLTATPADTTKAAPVVGIEREFGADSFAGGSVQVADLDYFYPGRVVATVDDIPVLAPVGAVYLVSNEGAYYTKVENETTGISLYRIGDAIHGYKPAGQTETITSNMVPAGMDNLRTSGFADTWTTDYWTPRADVAGNWLGQPDPADFGLHICFYRGKTFPVNNGTVMAPWATPHNNKWVVGAGAPDAVPDGDMSLEYLALGSGLYDRFWYRWLPILAERETLKATLYLTLYQYLQLSWADEILIENTGYLIRKINDTLPFTGKIEAELVRLVVR